MNINVVIQTRALLYLVLCYVLTNKLNNVRCDIYYPSSASCCWKINDEKKEKTSVRKNEKTHSSNVIARLAQCKPSESVNPASYHEGRNDRCETTLDRFAQSLKLTKPWQTSTTTKEKSARTDGEYTRFLTQHPRG